MLPAWPRPSEISGYAMDFTAVTPALDGSLPAPGHILADPQSRPPSDPLLLSASSGQPVSQQRAPAKVRTQKANVNHLATLRQLLSSIDNRTDNSRKPTANTIKSLYRSVEARGQLKDLDANDYSVLIRLFGSISVMHSAPKLLLTNADRPHDDPPVFPTTFLAQPETPRSHLSFAATLARDMRSAGHRLTSIDHYWLMLLTLSRLRGLKQERKQGTFHWFTPV